MPLFRALDKWRLIFFIWASIGNYSDLYRQNDTR